MKKILIVDNSIVIINILKDLFFKTNNFEIYEARSLAEVETLVKTEDFFIAISNVVLPDALDGQLLNIFKTNNIPTIILSSTIDNDFLSSLNSLNVIDYVLKDSIYGLETVYHTTELISFIENTNILLVEDSASMAMKMKDMIETLLVDVKIVKNGFEALEELEKNPNISLIISDYNMPQMNGLELTKNIRKDSKYSQIPIIITTSEEDKELKIKLFKTGANDFLTKPILEEELKSKILDLFSNKKKIEDIKRFDKIVDENVISSSTDKDGIIKNVSSAFVKLSGYSKEELIGKEHNILKHPDMPDSIYQELWNTISSGKAWRGEIKNKRKNQEDYWVSALIKPVLDKNNEIMSYYYLSQDITDKKKIYELSIKDGLTGLYNRRYFNEVASSFIKKPIRNANFVSFVILDVDNFKKYNDTYGHQDGDDVLTGISKALSDSFKRSNDLVFRLGGEEFGVLLNTKTVEDAIDIVQNARKAIENLAIEHSKNPPLQVVTASFGLIIMKCSEDEINNFDIDYIYKTADEQLYKAKESGRNKVETLILE